MEDMELDEIDRLISKRTWECFQIDMDRLEYQRQNFDLNHRIKLLRLQLNVPKISISKNIPCNNMIDSQQFSSEMRNAFQLDELKRNKIAAIEQSYHRNVIEIHMNSNEIIGLFENLSSVKKKRYFENEINSVKQVVQQIENSIQVSKQQLFEIRHNHEDFVRNFILDSVIHWKSITTVHEQIQNCKDRLNEQCNEIGITLNDVATMEIRVADCRKVYEQLKMEMELLHSQVPRMIAKLPITYNSLEQESSIIDSPTSNSPPIPISNSNNILIIENVLIKPADTVSETIKSQQDDTIIERDLLDLQVDVKKSQDFTKSDKSNKRNVTIDDNKQCSSSGEGSARKKSKITADHEIIAPKTDRQLRSHKIKPSDSNDASQKKLSEDAAEIEHLSLTFKKLSQKQNLNTTEHESLPSKCSSPVIPGLNISLISNLSGQESRRSTSDSNDEDFFLTNEGPDGFDFFQANDDDQLFTM